MILILNESLDQAEELLTEAFDLTKFTGIVSVNMIRSGKDSGKFQRPDITTEIMIDLSKLIDGDVDYDSILDEIIFLIRKRLATGLHVIQGDGQFMSDSIGSFFSTLPNIARGKMIINLHDKGFGLKTLREMFPITDDDIMWINDKLYEYDNIPPSSSEVEKTIQKMRILFQESEESLEMTRQRLLNRSNYNRWLKKDAITLFLNRFGEHNFNNDLFTIRHISSSIDGGDSLRRLGLLKLTELLMIESPLSLFLAENGIEIDVKGRTIKINGMNYCINTKDFGELHGKLYHDNGEIEGFISGEKEKELAYGANIRDCPEIIFSIDKILNNGTILQRKWEEKRKKTFLIEMNLKLAEFSLSFKPNADNLYVNEWVIKECLNDMCNNNIKNERYVALHGNVASERLRFFEV